MSASILDNSKETSMKKRWGAWRLLGNESPFLQTTIWGRAEYDISLSELATVENQERWIHHLQEKTWFTASCERDFRAALRDCTRDRLVPA